MTERETARDLYKLAQECLKKQLELMSKKTFPSDGEIATVVETTDILRQIKEYNLEQDYFLYVRDEDRIDKAEKAIKKARCLFATSAVLMAAAIAIVTIGS